ncbi:DUF2206 domain-containing protein [Methanocella conradii]|uniref:DUF2206 domain-containing protein n=1 Tax=Methanocella conradii TaxID=1175444 RepID=UPI0024B33C6F|nr:DUF2206 domain-containing protein [Methanocella conradii]MDI6896906.1 DUF2206 domain-containing protein [Methanocella conradii]
MQVSDPLRLIDWDIKKFLGVVLATQVAALILIRMDSVGFQVPALRQLVCFIYLTFIPGAVILRAMNVRKLGPVESTLFTIGMSLAALMFTGALLNLVGPHLGLATPITILPIMAMLTALVLVFSVACCLRDGKGEDKPLLDIGEALSPPALFLYIVPFLAVAGAYLMNLFNENALLAVMILILAAIVLLVGFDRFIPGRLYPLAIFVVALSLVLHNALISTYINGWDIQYERYYASLILNNGFWDTSLFRVLNAMLSIVMLAPIYSIVMNMDIAWVFKLAYPALFALVPLGLYEAFRRQANEKVAFMAAFFFTSLVVFYTEMIQLARQEIAELFLVLVILLLINQSMDKVKWSLLFIIFSFSVVVSHYGLTYIFIASLIIVWVMLRLGKAIRLKGLSDAGLNRRLSLALIIPLVTFCLAWYVFTASGNAFNTILVLLATMISNVKQGFLNPEMVQGMALIIEGGSVSALHKAYLYLMMFTQAFIVIGIAAIALKNDLARIGKEYFAFSLVMVALLVAGISIPYVSSALNTTRLYQITLIFLAIFFVLGWLGVSWLIGRVVRRNNPAMPIAFRALSIFLAIFLVFNTGLVFEVFRDVPISYSLNKTVDSAVFNSAEVAGASWIMRERSPIVVDSKANNYYLPPIYGDWNRLQLLRGLNASQAAEIPISGKLFEVSYVFMGTYNVLNDKVLLVKDNGAICRDYYVRAYDVSKDRGLIYSNGGSEVYNRRF